MKQHLSPVLPWWHRLGHSFSGASCPTTEVGALLPVAPAGPPQRLRNPAGLAPIRTSASRAPRTPREGTSHPSSTAFAGADRDRGPSPPPSTLGTGEPLPPPLSQGSVPAELPTLAGAPPVLVIVEEQVPAQETLSAPPSPSQAKSGEASTSKSPPRHPLARQPIIINEAVEAKLEMATLPTGNIIVRSQLDAAMQRQRDIAETGSVKKRVILDRLKEKQVAWRKKHDALVHRKRLQAARFRPTPEKPQLKSLDLFGEEVVSTDSTKFPLPLTSLEMTRTRSGTEDAEGLHCERDRELSQRFSSSPRPASSSSSGFASDRSDDGHAKGNTATISLARCSFQVPPGLTHGGPGRSAKTAPSSAAASRRNSAAASAKSPRRQSADNGQASHRHTVANALSAHRKRTSVSFVRMTSKSQAGNSPQPPEETTASTGPQEISFDSIVALAKKHNLRVDEVKKKWEEFHMYDQNGDVVLSMDEFKKVVRSLCGIREADPIPSHLFSSCWTAGDTDGDGNIDFEEFLLWSNGVQYCEEMMVPDPEERMLRKVARDHGLDLVDVERLKAPFDTYDADRCGISEQQFQGLVCDLLHTDPKDFSSDRMRRHWREVNPSGGQLLFGGFAVWWQKTYKDGQMVGPNSPRAPPPRNQSKRNTVQIDSLQSRRMSGVRVNAKDFGST